MSSMQPNRTSQPSKASFLQRLKALRHRGWLFELLCHFVSILIFLGIIAILKYYDKTVYNGNVRNKTFINGLITFLGTVMKGAMFVGVGSALGQLRWSWYKEHRKLADLETFGGATSSALGSLKLLLSFKFRYLASLGAVLTIMALSIEALISSTIQILSHPVGSGNTTLPIAHQYTTYDARTTGKVLGDLWPAFEMVSAIQFGSSFLSGLDDMVHTSWAVACGTSNCTFPRYQSLAVLSDCITEGTTVSNGHILWDNYDDGLIMPEDIGSIAVNSTLGYPPNGLPFGMIGPPIARTGIIVNSRGWTQPLGMHCVLFWANQDLIANVSELSDFQLNEQALRTNFTTQANAFDSQGFSWLASDCWINGTNFPTKNPDGSWAQEQCNFYISPQGQRGLENYFTDPFYGFKGQLLTSDNDTTQASPFIQNIEFIMDSDQVKTQDLIRQLWANTAAMMTRATRIVRIPVQNVTTRQMWRTENYYHINWYYMILPGVMVLACMLFTFSTWVKTRHDHAWKKSSLPFLFLGLGSKEKMDCKDIRTLEEMNEVAEQMDIKLADIPDDGLRFVRRE